MSRLSLRVQTGLVVLAAFCFFAVVVYLAIDIYERRTNPARVAYMLNISEPPSSIRVFECASCCPTDVVITCAIAIDAKQFPLLLTGYGFSQSQMDGPSHSLASSKVGPDFPVDVEYRAEPSTFEHGGSVTVLADKERRRALVDLYIE